MMNVGDKYKCDEPCLMVGLEIEIMSSYTGMIHIGMDYDYGTEYTIKVLKTGSIGGGGESIGDEMVFSEKEMYKYFTLLE